jgi:hypothetical protein
MAQFSFQQLPGFESDPGCSAARETNSHTYANSIQLGQYFGTFQARGAATNSPCQS